MQNQRMRMELRCPNCDQAMQGYSISYHNYKCSSCGTEVKGLTVANNIGFEQVIGAICLVGLIALFVSIFE